MSDKRYGHVHTLCYRCSQFVLIMTNDEDICCQCGRDIERGEKRTWSGDKLHRGCTRKTYIELRKKAQK